jgi:hypothetical protein
MRLVPIVSMKPDGRLGGALVGGVVGAVIGPFAQACADQSLIVDPAGRSACGRFTTTVDQDLCGEEAK